MPSTRITTPNQRASVESLEPRTLFSFATSINFQPAGVLVPANYLADTGETFAARASGQTYGWNIDRTAQAVARSSPFSPDLRYDTHINMQKGGNATWEIAVPNGVYRVRLVLGDPVYPTSIVKLNIENTQQINTTTNALRNWVEGSAIVNVSDGRLTLAPASGAKNLKLDFVEITDDLNAPAPARPQFPSIVRNSTIGTNLDGIADFSTISPFLDLANQFRQWGNITSPHSSNSAIPRNSDNYPLADAGAITFATGYPDGDYLVSYDGAPTVTFSGMQSTFNITSQTPSHTTGILHLVHPPTIEGDFLTMKVFGATANSTISNLHIISPDANLNQSTLFRPVFLQKLAAFDGPLRFMDWMQTNSSPIVNWSDRALASRFSFTGKLGVPYEHMIALANTLNKDVWINIPAGATDDYIAQLARLVRDTLNPSLKVYIEFSNEIWNGGSVQGQYLTSLANADTELTKTDPFGRAAEEMAKQTVRVSNIFRVEFGESRFASQARVTLGVLIAGDYWAKSALEFIALKYGEPKNFIHSVAVGLYVGNESDSRAIDNASLTLDTLFAWMHNWLDTTSDGWLKNHKLLTDTYELKLDAYEAGQHLTSSTYNMNESLKQQAQDDPRMADIYRHMIYRWNANGGDIFGNFALATKYSKFGYWGLLQNIQQTSSVKYDVVTTLASTTYSFKYKPEVVSAQSIAKTSKPKATITPLVVKRPVFSRRKLSDLFA